MATAPAPTKLVVWRKAEYHDSVGKYYTYKVDIPVNERLRNEIFEFINKGEHSDFYELRDVVPNT